VAVTCDFRGDGLSASNIRAIAIRAITPVMGECRYSKRATAWHTENDTLSGYRYIVTEWTRHPVRGDIDRSDDGRTPEAVPHNDPARVSETALPAPRACYIKRVGSALSCDGSPVLPPRGPRSPTSLWRE
jgi:hypothetical protein